MNTNEIMRTTTNAAINQLKIAMMYRKTRELHWHSSDGEYLYTASSPLDPDISAEDYGNMPTWRADEILNGWIMQRVHMGRIGLEAAIDATLFTVAPTELEVIEWDIPTSLFDPGVDDPHARIEMDTNYKAGLDAQSEPILQDMANVDNAIFDLRKDTEEFVRELRMKRANMTQEEKFRERELRRQWDAEPPRNETGHKVWWSVSAMSFLVTVYANTAEEAIQIVEDEFNGGMEMMMFFISIEKDTSQKKFEPYKDEKVKRLIPFSNVVWPEDPDSITDEQKAAFDRLSR